MSRFYVVTLLAFALESCSPIGSAPWLAGVAFEGAKLISKGGAAAPGDYGNTQGAKRSQEAFDAFISCKEETGYQAATIIGLEPIKFRGNDPTADGALKSCLRGKGFPEAAQSPATPATQWKPGEPRTGSTQGSLTGVCDPVCPKVGHE